MKLTWTFVILIAVGIVTGEDTPGFFLKVTKNVPRVRTFEQDFYGKTLKIRENSNERVSNQ
jgi:hypothetical protein